MSTKKLLNESDIRRFMKLAAIRPLTENFFDNLSEEAEDEELGGEEEMPAPDLEGGEGEEPLPDLEPEAGEEEMPAPEEGPGEAQVDLSEEDAETLMAAIGDALSDVTGLDVEVVQGGDEEMAEPEEGPAEEPEMGDEDMGDLEEALDEAEIAVDEEVSVESVVNEVTMRVAKRLLAESKKN